jgi:hypothetical protein
MKGIVRVVFEIEVDTDDQEHYDIVGIDDPEQILEEMVKFDVDVYPEMLEIDPTEVAFKEWVK